MIGNEQHNRFNKPVSVAATLTIIGLITALIYMWTPVTSPKSALTMVVFLMMGVPLMALSIAIFFLLWRKDVKARLRAWSKDQFGPDQIIFKEGDPGDRVYFIESGEVEVVRNGVVLAKLGPGEYFGEMALLNHKPRNATVRAVKKTQIISMGPEQFTARTSVSSVREAFEKRARERQS